MKSSASYSDPQGAQERRDRPQHQNYQKPLGKSWNHEIMDRDIAKTIRIIMKSWNGMGCLGWDMSQGSGSGGYLRNRSRIPWFDDYMHETWNNENMKWNWSHNLIYEIMKSWNNLIITWLHIWNHEDIWYEISYFIWNYIWNHILNEIWNGTHFMNSTRFHCKFGTVIVPGNFI